LIRADVETQLAFVEIVSDEAEDDDLLHFLLNL
jgi:hypothetical protein